MERRLFMDARVPDDGKLDEYFPNGKLSFRHFGTEPEDLPERFEDELIVNLYRHAEFNGIYGDNNSWRGMFTTRTPGYIIPEDITQDNLPDYLKRTYPDLLPRYEQFMRIFKKYDGAYDKRLWRERNWGGGEPETLKSKTMEDANGLIHFQCILKLEGGYPYIGFSQLGHLIGDFVQVYNVNDFGHFVLSSIYGPGNPLQDTLQYFQRVSDTHFNLKDFGFTGSRNGYRYLELR